MASLVPEDVCDVIILLAGGTITIPDHDSIKITEDATFTPACNIENGTPTDTIVEPEPIASTLLKNLLERNSDDITFSDYRDPFYASTFPQCYALAATTVLAYMLLVMLVITPRSSFLDAGLGAREAFSASVGFTGRGFKPGRIGNRPWLQKIAVLTVAISLTIASVETFKEAERQYSWGIENAKTIQKEVLGGTLLKIIRLLSSTLLWLAQAQTLTRLFPHRREKVIIKWTAFALITLGLIFDSLNSFLYTSSRNTFTQAIPALNYLFQLALGLLYAAWVIYFAIGKKKYAFYHSRMGNMAIVAMLSLMAVLVPVVFFILDIAKPDFAGWGDYVRWVGAAAASVIVWEWVERIEVLEHEDKKDGILGREVFDGDDMLDTLSGGPRGRGKGDFGSDTGSGAFAFADRLRRLLPGMPFPPFMPRKSVDDSTSTSQGQAQISCSESTGTTGVLGGASSQWPPRPPVAVGARDSSAFDRSLADFRRVNSVPGNDDVTVAGVAGDLSREPSRMSAATSPIHQGHQGRPPYFPTATSTSPPPWVAYHTPADLSGHPERGSDASQRPSPATSDEQQPAPGNTSNESYNDSDEPLNQMSPPAVLLQSEEDPGDKAKKTSRWDVRARLGKLRSKFSDEPRGVRHLDTLVIPPPPGPAIEDPEIQRQMADMTAPSFAPHPPDLSWDHRRRMSTVSFGGPGVSFTHPSHSSSPPNVYPFSLPGSNPRAVSVDNEGAVVIDAPCISPMTVMQPPLPQTQYSPQPQPPHAQYSPQPQHPPPPDQGFMMHSSPSPGTIPVSIAPSAPVLDFDDDPSGIGGRGETAGMVPMRGVTTSPGASSTTTSPRPNVGGSPPPMPP